MLRWLTAGESHGPELIAVLEGLPAGVPVSLDGIRADLARRKLGSGRGARMAFEQDELSLSTGVVHGRTLGSPIAVRIGNTEWPKWVDIMSPEPVDPEKLQGARAAALTRPRPGHADLVGMRSTTSTRRDPSSSARAPARPRPASRSAQWRARSSPSGGSRSSATRSPSAPYACPRARRCRRPPTWTRWTRIRCAASTPRPAPAWSPRWTTRSPAATRSAASSRSSPTTCRPASDRTCTGTAASTRSSRPRSWASRRSRASRSATASSRPRAAGPRPTTSCSRRTPASAGPRTAPAAPRAACRRARSSASARA